RDLKSIRDHISETSTSGPAVKRASQPKYWKWLMPAAIGVAGLVVGGSLAALLMPKAVAPEPKIHTLTFSGNDFSPSVSPDGRTVAFVSGRDGTLRIWLKQIVSGSETVLTPGPGDNSPRFSPDGAWVMFIRNHAA